MSTQGAGFYDLFIPRPSEQCLSGASIRRISLNTLLLAFAFVHNCEEPSTLLSPEQEEPF